MRPEMGRHLISSILPLSLIRYFFLVTLSESVPGISSVSSLFNFLVTTLSVKSSSLFSVNVIMFVEKYPMSPPAVGYMEKESMSFPFLSYVAKIGITMSAAPIAIMAM